MLDEPPGLFDSSASESGLRLEETLQPIPSFEAADPGQPAILAAGQHPLRTPTPSPQPPDLLLLTIPSKTAPFPECGSCLLLPL